MIHIWKITNTKSDEIHFADEASLDTITRQLPEGYYSTFRTYDGGRRVLGLTAHFQRLPNADASLLRRNLNRLLEPFRPGEARIRVMMTKQGQAYIAIEPLIPLPREVYEKGVRVETTTIQRIDPRAKSTIFIAESDEERKHIAQRGIFEALLVKNGRILEGMTSNFFYILDSRAPESASGLRERRTKSADEAQLQARASSATSSRAACSVSAQRGILYTAQRDILLGVTRRTVIRAARGRGIEVRYSPLKLDQLPAVSEAFITSSSRGIVPVIQIDEVLVGDGGVGELTKQLSAAYEAYVIQKAEKI